MRLSRRFRQLSRFLRSCPFLYASVQGQQVEIEGEEKACSPGSDGGQGNGTCDGPWNQGRQKDDGIFQIQGQVLRLLIFALAQLAGQHGGQRLVAAEHGGDDTGRADGRETPQLSGQMADETLNVG